jgi:hypothetical protein
VLAALCATLCACGKKGPPLPPLNLVPDRPMETAGRVVGDTAYLSVTVPAKNANGGGPLALDHLEIYAITVDAGATPPPNRELLTSAHAIARIPIKPPVDPDAPEEEADDNDTRPAAGDKIVFAEPLTEAQTTPQVKATAKTETATPAAAPPSETAGESAGASASSTPAVPPLLSPESVPATGGGGSVGGVPPALPATAPAAKEPPAGAASSPTASSQVGAVTVQPAAPKPPPTVTRIYVVRGMTKKGRPGTPSARIVVPIVPPPPPPSNVAADFGETSVTVTWTPPEMEAEPHPPLTYNVYSISRNQPSSGAAPTTPSSGVAAAPAPLNPQPIDTLSLEHGGAEPGKEQCFVVRTVETIAATPIESAPSAPVCVTPVDRFPPAAPKSLAVVATTGAMNLIWDANSEPDLAGYLVLRGETPGDTLQPLTPEPIREPRFRDTTATPGVRYVYAIVAVDRAANRSAPSARVEETAR